MLRISAALGDPRLRARVIAQGCYLRPDLERIDARVDACRTIRELAREAADLSMEVFGNMFEAYLELQRGRRPEAEAAAARLLSVESDPRISTVRPLAYFWRCLMAQLDGRLRDAHAWCTAGVQLGADLNFSDESQMAVFATQQWWLLQLEGQTGAMVEPWREYVAQHPDIASIRIPLARIYAEVGRLDDARIELEQLGPDPLAAVPRDDNWCFFASVAADVCADVADAERAARLAALLEPFSARIALAGWILTTPGAIARPLARLCFVLGRRDEAEAHFAHALSLHHQLASPPLVVWTLLDHARALEQHGRRSDAARIRRLRASAFEAAESADLHVLAARAKSSV
jgi:tetratricopeptide (TPR) repeat protein